MFRIRHPNQSAQGSSTGPKVKTTLGGRPCPGSSAKERTSPTPQRQSGAGPDGGGGARDQGDPTGWGGSTSDGGTTGEGMASERRRSEDRRHMDTGQTHPSWIQLANVTLDVCFNWGSRPPPSRRPTLCFGASPPQSGFGLRVFGSEGSSEALREESPPDVALNHPRNIASNHWEKTDRGKSIVKESTRRET